MGNFKLSKLLGALIALLLVSATGFAALGDIWALPGNVWRVTSSYHLTPGVTNSYDIGSASVMPRSVYANDVYLVREKLGASTVTTNATISQPYRLVYIGSISGNRTYVLPAPTAGAIMEFQDTAGNVNVNGNVTLDAGSGKTINGSQTKVISTTYGGLKLQGVSTTAWAAR